MANEKNLIPIKTLSKEEAKKRGSKGGKKSAESRRNKKLLKDCMLDLLDLPVSQQKTWNKLARMGIDPKKIDNRALLTASLFLRAVETGDVSAFKEIRDLIGENNKNTDDDINKLDEVLAKIGGNI